MDPPYQGYRYYRTFSGIIYHLLLIIELKIVELSK